MGLCANNVVLRSEQEGNFPGSVAKTSRFRWMVQGFDPWSDLGNLDPASPEGGPKEREWTEESTGNTKASHFLPAASFFLRPGILQQENLREGPARLNPPGRMRRQEGTEGQGGKPPCRQGGRGQAILSQRTLLPYQTPWVCPFGDHWVTLQWLISESSKGVLREAISEGLSRGRGGAQIECALFRKTQRRVGKMGMELGDAEKSPEGVREKHSQTGKWWKSYSVNYWQKRELPGPIPICAEVTEYFKRRMEGRGGEWRGLEKSQGSEKLQKAGNGVGTCEAIWVC